MTARMVAAFSSTLGIFAFLQASSAQADAIDGHWCHEDGRRLSIQGRSIATPGGRQMEGEYSRHAFSYAAPAGEAQAGQIIAMQLRSETLVEMQPGAAPSEMWRRCTATTS